MNDIRLIRSDRHLSFMSVNCIMHWNEEFPIKPVHGLRLSTFGATTVMHPNSDVFFFKVYFSWRQADCHISNLYNTSFWGLIRKCTLSPQDGENALKGILAKDKQRDSFFFRDVE